MASAFFGSESFVLISTETRTECVLHIFRLSSENHLTAQYIKSINMLGSIKGLHPGKYAVYVNLEHQNVVALTTNDLCTNDTGSIIEISELKKQVC